MSRSALQKEFLKKQSQVAAPVPPPELLQMQQQQQYYMQYQQAMMGMPGMAAPMTMPTVSGQPVFVPIPLTGDEEDNDASAATSNVLPMYGNTSNFNINNLLYNNVMENEYFRALYQLRTYHEVIDEIYRSVDHVEPWQTGTARFPSSAFCLLVKFMLMKLTLKQMKGLLGTADCTNVRAIGFLYLRYTCPPADLWKWFEPYLEDTEEFTPGADKSVKMTVGDYCIKLLTDMQYFGTTLPRIPVPIERKMKVMLLLLEEKKKRRRSNLRDKERGLYCVGAKVRAIYSDEANEPAWYEAVIDSVDEEATDGNKFWVTFPEYGNTERVDLGDMELLGSNNSSSTGNSNGKEENSRQSAERSRSTDRRRSDRSRSRDRGNSNADRRDSRDRGDRGSRGGDRDRDRDREGGRERRGDSRDRRGGRDDSRDRRSSRREDSRSPSRDRDRGALAGAGGSTSNLLEKVLQSQREASAAVGKNYGHRPASYKGSLSSKMDRYTVRRKSPSPEYRSSGGARKRERSPSRDRSSRPAGSSAGGSVGGASSGGGGGMSSAAAEEQLRRMRMLKDRYGDASATSK